MKKLTLTIVIPVYNEENHLKKCLDAVSAQSTLPLEVIVVDNNSTDSSVDIASGYPFVRVIKETVQGRTSARNAGFNSARGDIIGRIDADSVIMPGWTESLLKDFIDPSVKGVTGLGRTRVLIGVKDWYSTFWSRAYYMAVYSFFGTMTMWGANMAIRRSEWTKIKHDVAENDVILHEDQDLSLVLAGHGGTIIKDTQLLITTAGGSYLYWPKFWSYFKKTVATKSYHQQNGTLKRIKKHHPQLRSAKLGAIVGWFLTAVFIVYSLLSWPIIALMLRFNKKVLDQKR